MVFLKINLKKIASTVIGIVYITSEYYLIGSLIANFNSNNVNLIYIAMLIF